MSQKSPKSEPKKLAPSSPEFEEAFRGGFGGCRMTCDCGREHFDRYNGYDWEEGELEELERLAEEQPDNYVGNDHECSSIVIDGKTFVQGCPCNQLRVYENFVRNHAEQLAKFLVVLRKERLDWAEALKAADILANFPPDPRLQETQADPGFLSQSWPGP